MNFRISGLPSENFRHLFDLPDAELARHGAVRVVADARPGFPDRIALRDAEIGERLLLLNYTHQPAANAYRASHAIFVLEGAQERFDEIGKIPEVIRVRPISLRAFDASHLMIDADLVDGAALQPVIERLLGNPRVAYLHAHYAKRGCYAARIDRA